MPWWRRPVTIVWTGFALELAWAAFAAAVLGVGDRSRPRAPDAPFRAELWLAGAILIAIGAGLLAWRAGRTSSGR
jgi:hypothetical protein